MTTDTIMTRDHLLIETPHQGNPTVILMTGQEIIDHATNTGTVDDLSDETANYWLDKVAEDWDDCASNEDGGQTMAELIAERLNSDADSPAGVRLSLILDRVDPEMALRIASDALGRDLAVCTIIPLAGAYELAEKLGTNTSDGISTRVQVQRLAREYWIINEAAPSEIVKLLFNNLFTQRAIAEELEVRQPTVSAWASGKQSMTRPIRKLAANYLSD